MAHTIFGIWRGNGCFEEQVMADMWRGIEDVWRGIGDVWRSAEGLCGGGRAEGGEGKWGTKVG